MNLATCEEEKLRVECQVEGRPKTSKVRCPMGTNNWLCKGVREEEEIACCDYACDQFLYWTSYREVAMVWLMDNLKKDINYDICQGCWEGKIYKIHVVKQKMMTSL